MIKNFTPIPKKRMTDKEREEFHLAVIKFKKEFKKDKGGAKEDIAKIFL